MQERNQQKPELSFNQKLSSIFNSFQITTINPLYTLACFHRFVSVCKYMCVNAMILWLTTIPTVTVTPVLHPVTPAFHQVKDEVNTVEINNLIEFPPW